MAGDPPPTSHWRRLEDAAEPAGTPRDAEASSPEFETPAAVRIDRRDALRLLGATLALAGATACGERPRAPLLSRPADAAGVLPGKPLLFATSVELDGYGRGVLVRSHDGRPDKVEGNPRHPASLGATDAFMQADVLALHDPDRSSTPRRDGTGVSWTEWGRQVTAVREALARDSGAGTHLLFGATASPTFGRVLERLRAAYPGLRVHTYSPVSDPLDAAPQAVHAFDAPDAVLSLGADFLGAGPAQVRHARDWASRRADPRRSRPWLAVAEASPTLTGADADERLPLAPEAIERLAFAVGAALGVVDAPSTPAAERIARRLAAGPALVLAGPDAGPRARALAARMNERLGARALRYVAPVRLGAAQGVESAGALLEALHRGAVERLLVIDANPAYDLPGAAPLLARAADTLHAGGYFDETARRCRWHVPLRHVFESWGDTRAFDGTVGLQQPATTPLRRALAGIELLARLLGEDADDRTLVRERWRDLPEPEFLAALEAGVVPATAAEAVQAPRDSLPAAPAEAARATSVRDGATAATLTLRADPRTWDGRYANNAWLQELAHPLTKLAWGNAALIAPATAHRLGLANGDRVAIERGPVAVEAPVWITPGQAPEVVTLTLGYGRRAAGTIGDGVGVDAYPLSRGGNAVGVRKLPGRERLVSTQSHRPLGPGAPGPTGATTPLPSFYPEFAGGEHAWAMAIDLDACIGCGTCTIACQAENNVPVVGPDEVAHGRDMQWIRVDRYHAGPADAPTTSFQPVPCMHCEQAPCEVVCPVGATTHSREGLNEMVYNRCIGTRTCSNNCPYKVRRFNWYDYHSRPPRLPPGVHNPRVTVRERGVMEKCTYCVQRIEAARTDAAVAGRPLLGDAVVPACAQACPTRAITFGDLAQRDGALVQRRTSERHYALLGELNTRPRTTYLARLARGGGDS